MIRAIIFDLDGVLVNAMDWHAQSFLAAYRALTGHRLDRAYHDTELAGLPTREKLKLLTKTTYLTPFQRDAFEGLKQRFTLRQIERRCRPDPARVALLRHFQGHFLLGCVTNCITQTTNRMLEKSQLRKYLEVVVTNEMAAPKPDPAGYRLACGMLGILPTDVLVIEDHPRGVVAAQKAGCQVNILEHYADLTPAFVWEGIQRADAYAVQVGSG